MFDCWMKILNNCKKSVLLILQNNKTGQKNLLQEANKYNISKDRIIFTERVKNEIHMERLGNINLFLDTFPYGAHTTAREALSMNTPILTLVGNSFASRVAGSLLINLNLTELVAYSKENYIEIATNLANNFEKYNFIKKKIFCSKNKNEIFDNKIFTKDLENLYKSLFN